MRALAPNTYSPSWFALFLPPDAEPPQQEIEFLQHWLPREHVTSVLDVCCGPGRHVRSLARLGYDVTGIDRSSAVLDQARRRAGARERYVEADMRLLGAVDGAFDAVVNLWQSFGGFDAETNNAVFAGMTEKLTPNGRVIMDLYNASFFVGRDGTRVREQSGMSFTETKRLRDGRLTVNLDYGGGRAGDVFEWQLYTADELTSLAATLGLRRLAACSKFDVRATPSRDEPRMQLVFSRDQ
jgi:SAM-dependent methyltransferase